MGARGPGSGRNPLALAAKAARNPRILPRRLRQVQLTALDHLWDCYRPPDGSRFAKFKVAYLRTVRQARELQIPGEVFLSWSDRLRFLVDDRDDDAE